VTIADFMIDQPALLEINRKIAMMGGVLFHVSCSRENSMSTANVVFLGPLA
jgi:hypothetical protein